MADLEGNLEAVFCYALIKTIYKSKCTCIKIARFLLGYRLFCFIVVFYLDLKLLKLSPIKVILLQYISYWSTEFLNQAFFFFCAFLLYIVTQVAHTFGAGTVWCCTQNLDEASKWSDVSAVFPLAHLLEEITGWNLQITDKFIFLVKKEIHLVHYYSNCNTALRGPRSYPHLAAQGCHCLQLVWQDRIR